MMIPFSTVNRALAAKPGCGCDYAGHDSMAAFNCFRLKWPPSPALQRGANGMPFGPRAYGSIDTRIFVFIAGAIPFGVAMQKTGTATMLANGCSRRWQAGLSGWFLLALFAVVAVVTQFMSDAATTALFAPVAIASGTGPGRTPEPYVVTVAMAAWLHFSHPSGITVTS
jgi:di/tricarboxylate transporter